MLVHVVKVGPPIMDDLMKVGHFNKGLITLFFPGLLVRYP